MSPAPTSQETLDAWIKGADDLIESGVATDNIAVCPLALRRLCREVLERRAVPTAISVVQMIQALRGCVQQLNQNDDHKAALKAQQTLVCLDELYRELSSVGGDDMPYEPFPFIRTQYEIDREREIREWEERNAGEQRS